MANWYSDIGINGQSADEIWDSMGPNQKQLLIETVKDISRKRQSDDYFVENIHVEGFLKTGKGLDQLIRDFQYKGFNPITYSVTVPFLGYPSVNADFEYFKKCT